MGLLLHVIPCMAQADFQLTVPSFKKFIRIVASDVNLRKGPGTNYPRLVEQPDDPYSDGYFEMETVWSSKPLTRHQSAVRADNEVLPVIGESGDWVQMLLTNQSNGKGEKVWTMKKSCKEVTLRPLGDIHEAGDLYDIIRISQGTYKDICLACGYEEQLGDKPNAIYVGRYVDGMYVFNYMIPYFYVEEGTRQYFEDAPSWSAIEAAYWFYYGDSFCHNKAEYQMQPDLKKLVADPTLLSELIHLINEITGYQASYRLHYYPVAIFGVDDTEEPQVMEVF